MIPRLGQASVLARRPRRTFSSKSPSGRGYLLADVLTSGPEARVRSPVMDKLTCLDLGSLRLEVEKLTEVGFVLVIQAG
jgi:hypothetical protein